MQLHRILSSLVIASALFGAPAASSAEPAPIATQSTPAKAPKPTPVNDVERYAEREKQSPAAAEFEGGGETVVYIGGSLLTVVVILLLVVIILCCERSRSR